MSYSNLAWLWIDMASVLATGFWREQLGDIV